MAHGGAAECGKDPWREISAFPVCSLNKEVWYILLKVFLKSTSNEWKFFHGPTNAMQS